MAVSMWAVHESDVEDVLALGRRFPAFHGPPLHVGDPKRIGLNDFGAPEWGDAVALLPYEVPVFWACGITPQIVAANAGVSAMVTNSPSHMLITDVLSSRFESRSHANPVVKLDVNF
jgi:uncharacterized protein YcsI (UPF0317 family)